MVLGRRSLLALAPVIAISVERETAKRPARCVGAAAVPEMAPSVA